MTHHMFRFDPTHVAAFKAQAMGVDPYTPGKRCRAQLADVLSWGLDVDRLRTVVRNEGVAVLTGLPTDDDLPLSPEGGKRPTDKRTFVSESLLNAVSMALGLHPVAFHNEKEGDLIHQITPVPGHEQSASNQGSNQFEMHTEATHMPYPPNVLALTCVRNTERGETNFIRLSRAMRYMSREVEGALRAPLFTQAMGVSSGGGGRYRLPVLSGSTERPIFRLDFTDVEALTPQGKDALDWLRGWAIAEECSWALQPGDMVILNNHTTLHGRVGFTPDYSKGKPRWLQRQYMTDNPWAGAPADTRFPHVWKG